MTTADVFILRSCTVDDWVRDHGLPRRPGPSPACSASAILPFALARELLGYDAERRSRRVVRAEWRPRFPDIPHQSELHRRRRGLQGALALRRQHGVAAVPASTGDWLAIDTPPLPVKPPRRVRGPDHWAGPDGRHAGFGRGAAKALWFYGCRLAVLAPLLTSLPLVWALVPAAVNARAVAEWLLEALHDLQLLVDKGFRGKTFAATLAEQAITVLVPPTTAERDAMPAADRAFIAAHRNRSEGSVTRAKDQFHLEQHRALSFWGLRARVTTRLAALTLDHRWRHAGLALA